MHNLKFCNKLLSLVLLNFKQNNLWFDIVSTKKMFALLFIFQKVGIISSFYIFNKVYNKNIRKFFRIFLKYINLEISFILPFFFYFKPSHKLPISLSSLKKLNKTVGDISIIISTSKGLRLLSECLDLGISGILFLIIYT